MDKEKFIDLKKMIKQENGSGQRLQSLRMPRDLNLGGAGPKVIKKQFIPNLNVVRNKDKVKDVTRKIEQKRNIRINKHVKQINSEQRFVQSSGLFSDGIGVDGKRSSRSGGKHSSIRENDVTASMSVPTITKNVWEINLKKEESILDEIVSQISDDEYEEEKLPFQPLSWSEKDFKSFDYPNTPCKNPNGNCDTSSIKLEIKNELDNLPISKVKLENSDNPTDESFCSNQHPTLNLWRLPDSFAGRNLSDDPISDPTRKCTKITDYTLLNMPEGQIGKLILRKSGRTEIQIGRMKFELEPTELSSFREEIVALNVKENEESSAAVLGQVINGFVMSPDWYSLLKENRL